MSLQFTKYECLNDCLTLLCCVYLIILFIFLIPLITIIMAWVMMPYYLLTADLKVADPNFYSLLDSAHTWFWILFVGTAIVIYIIISVKKNPNVVSASKCIGAVFAIRFWVCDYRVLFAPGPGY